MTISEIKAAVDAGNRVHWVNDGYEVIRDRLGQYLIIFWPNRNCIGLTNKSGDRLNGQPQDFYIGGNT